MNARMISMADVVHPDIGVPMTKAKVEREPVPSTAQRPYRPTICSGPTSLVVTPFVFRIRITFARLTDCVSSNGALSAHTLAPNLAPTCDLYMCMSYVHEFLCSTVVLGCVRASSVSDEEEFAPPPIILQCLASPTANAQWKLPPSFMQVQRHPREHGHDCRCRG